MSSPAPKLASVRARVRQHPVPSRDHCESEAALLCSALIGLVVRAVAVTHEVFRLGDDIGGGYSEQGVLGEASPRAPPHEDT